MINEKQLERIVAVHGETHGLASNAVKILGAERIRVSVQEVIDYWGERGLKGYKYSDYIRMKITEYAAQFGPDMSKITEALRRDLQPISSVEYTTVGRVMKELGLYKPGKHGGPRNLKELYPQSKKTKKKFSKEKRAYYRGCVSPELIGTTIR